jgi:hypothetical protein
MKYLLLIIALIATPCFADIITENADGSFTVTARKATLAQLKEELEVAKALKKDILSKYEIELSPVNLKIEQLKADIETIRIMKAPKPTPTPIPTPIVDGYIYDQ